MGFRQPDANGVHFAACIAACKALCEREGIQQSELHLWLDYSAIPQLNRYMQRAAIDSIGSYASTCRYFIAVAPETLHVNTEKLCDDPSS